MGPTGSEKVGDTLLLQSQAGALTAKVSHYSWIATNDVQDGELEWEGAIRVKVRAET